MLYKNGTIQEPLIHAICPPFKKASSGYYSISRQSSAMESRIDAARAS